MLGVMSPRREEAFRCRWADRGSHSVITAHNGLVETCTPTGVDSHRLLVQAERVADPTPADVGPTRISEAGTGPGFPWWAVQLIGGSILLVGAVFRLTRSIPRP